MTMDFEEHRYTSGDGLSLYYRAYGSGPETVICLPGLTRNSKDFEDLAQFLAQHYTVITPDLRGRGQSDFDPKWKQYLPHTYVGDIWTLMDQLGIEKVAIIGTSLGALMAMIMADQQPQRLRGVVMNDVGPFVPKEAINRLLTYVGRTPAQDSWSDAVDVTRENYQVAYPEEGDAFWQRQTAAGWRERDDGRIVPDYDPAIGDAMRHAAKAAGLVRFLQRLGIKRLKGMNLDPWDNFRCMNMPVLVLRGAISDILTPPTIDEMRQVKPDLELVEVPGRGHAPTLDEPLAREAIEKFLAGIHTAAKG